ncbi:hypothetical protein [Aliiglaciecola sp. NS0011-25]|uniref:hypothetical protein n=1 Tax=Aliiglaciecola sp. NS0011-25 TaxID=3127654 RepID=UPI0031055569
MADSIKALEQFFNDLIAQVIPGALVVLVLCSITDFELPQHTSAILMFFGISYSVGHIVLALDESLRLIVNIFSKPNENLTNEAKDSDVVNAKDLFVKLLNEKNSGVDVSNLPLNELRSLAMSVSKEAADLGRRFMFLSLSCKSTVILLLIFMPFLTTYEFLRFLAIYKFDLNIFVTILSIVTILMLLTILIIYPVELRSQNFKRRAKEVPFSAAMANLILNKESNNDT